MIGLPWSNDTGGRERPLLKSPIALNSRSMATSSLRPSSTKVNPTHRVTEKETEAKTDQVKKFPDRLATIGDTLA